MTVIMETGAHAASLAAKSARVDVIAGYPITPQTSVMEAVAEMIEAGEMKSRFIPVEGEHSVMAATAAASAAGARVFTATASQGLLYMHEVLHMVAGGRLPVVMANVNRGVFAPWTLWTDYSDSISQRDTGWIQLYCGTVQEIYNAIIQGYRIAEQTNIPVMVNFDGFSLSHCLMPLNIPDQEVIDSYLPPHDALWRLDPENPNSFSNVTLALEYAEYRKLLAEDTLKSFDIVKKAAAEYKEKTGMWEGDVFEPYLMDDAEVVIFAMGSMASELRLSVDYLREQGIKAGVLRLRLFRPFPKKEIIEALPKNATVAVLDRCYSYGHVAGVLAEELKGTLFGVRNDITIKETVMGIGGVNIDWKFMANEISQMLEV